MYQNPKSANLAGILGIILGIIGAHNWYLGENSKGIAHSCLAAISFITIAIINVILPATLDIYTLLSMESVITIILLIGYSVAIGNIVWALIESIILLSQGDAGLSKRGYQVMPRPVQQNYTPQPINSLNSLQQNNQVNNPNNQNNQN